MPSIAAPVEVSVLRWARESCGLSQLAASRKLGLSDDRVSAWEDGTATPSIAQLRKASEVYRRSLAVFFLSEPPAEFDTLRDFRRIAGSVEGEWSPALHDEYRRGHTQRDFAVELAETEDRELPLTWRIPIAGSDSDVDVAARSRLALLDIGPLPLPGASGTPYEFLNAWVAAVEAAGVLVLNTKGGRVSREEMRAFSLYFDVLPVIVLNGADAPRGRLFSLLHEFAHLALHTEGLCDTTSDAKAMTPNRSLEARCNAIAAMILMPEDQVRRRPEVIARDSTPEAWDYVALRQAAAPFGVSAEAFLRRLSTLGIVPVSYYERRRDEFEAAYEKDDSGRPQGGNWYRNTVRDLGKGYVRAVTDAHRRRVIDSNTAAIYLNAKVGQIAKLAENAALREVG
ncbi:XRE family transcriptional regulator [Rhodococcus sp. IEGM1428]|uniref:XRE family transcriptional regulator n=1 Tax=Rhodococcus sp. IEGM1428 TaxID=3392191 RepID=UPI003D0A4D72